VAHKAASHPFLRSESATIRDRRQRAGRFLQHPPRRLDPDALHCLGRGCSRVLDKDPSEIAGTHANSFG
jgi:hypothetical protein